MDKNTGAKWVNANMVAAGYCFDNNELFEKCVSGELNKFDLYRCNFPLNHEFAFSTRKLRNEIECQTLPNLGVCSSITTRQLSLMLSFFKKLSFIS